MTAQEVLAKVLGAGGRVVPDPQRLRLLVPPDLKSLVTEHREALRELLQSGPERKECRPEMRVLSTPVPALRRALRAWYAMTAREADGNLPTPEEARALLSEVRRLWDDVGPAFAEAVARQEACTYYRETRRCPFCGERGVFHDSDRGGEPA